MTAARGRAAKRRIVGPPQVDLAPYVAWLAVRVPDELVRRRCRRVAEAYLEWLWADGGPTATRRSRFIRTSGRSLELEPADVGHALDLLAEHRTVVARTLPVDQ